MFCVCVVCLYCLVSLFGGDCLWFVVVRACLLMFCFFLLCKGICVCVFVCGVRLLCGCCVLIGCCVCCVVRLLLLLLWLCLHVLAFAYLVCLLSAFVGCA